jgi:hypothetical protein
MGEITKARSDAWDATLTEAQRWQTYSKLRMSPWYEVSKWCAKEFGIEAPSRSGIYRWNARMRELESSHRIEQAIVARNEVDGLAAAAGQTDAHLIDAYKTLASDLAMRQGDAAGAMRFTKMALAIAAQQTKAEELRLKASGQETKDKALRLAREKFEAAEKRIQATRDTIARLNKTGALTPDARKEIEKAMGIL